VILVIVVGTVRLIGGNANNVFSQVASSISN
jgi:Flp pilus assembly pilin Flp